MTADALHDFLRDQAGLIQGGRLDQAEARLEAMLARHPGTDGLLHQKMCLLAQRQQFEQAFAVSLQLSPAFKGQPQVTQQILAIMQAMRTLTVNADVEAELCRILELGSVDCSVISEIVHKIFALRLAEFQSSAAPLAACSDCRLLHAILRQFWLVRPDAEALCTGLRRQVLLQLHAEPASAADLAALALSLAMQGSRNEYAFHADRDELAQVDAMQARLAAPPGGQPAGSPDATLAPLLASLMYRPPRALGGAVRDAGARLQRSYPELAEFIDADLEEQEILARYTRDFGQGTGAVGDTSAAVARMYTENPYPRWVTPEWNTNTQALTYPEFYMLTGLPGWQTVNEQPPRRLLVAGCGTGWHPISQAICFPWLDITAIDISAGSLAYARLMAERLGIGNIDFRQADILALDDSEEPFDIVESVGVLHHLQDPEAGLRRLVGRLRPGGIIRLGLYSRLARQSIIEFRREKPYDEGVVDADFIRDLRHRFYHDPGLSRFRAVLDYPDFYSISGCRDLLLHEQEAQFSVVDLQRILADNGLQFLTFSPAHVHRFQQLGGLGSPFELGAWQAVEEREPRLFRGMYQFFAQLAV